MRISGVILYRTTENVVQRRDLVSACYLVRLRGGVCCNLFVLRDSREGFMIGLLIEFISDVCDDAGSD